MLADWNLVGSVGDLYCFSNTLSMLVFMCLVCVLSIAVFEIVVFIMKIQWHSKLMEDPRKNSSVRQLCYQKY